MGGGWAITMVGNGYGYEDDEDYNEISCPREYRISKGGWESDRKDYY